MHKFLPKRSNNKFNFPKRATDAKTRRTFIRNTGKTKSVGPFVVSISPVMASSTRGY